MNTNGCSTTKTARRFHQRALIWDLEETRALLELLKDQRIFKAIESVRTREIYHEIAERLKQAGFNRDWNQIRGRVKNLKFSYKKARALHEEQGQSTLTCRFYDDLHLLFGHKYKRQKSKKRSIQINIEPENEIGEISSNTTDEDEEEEVRNFAFHQHSTLFSFRQSINDEPMDDYVQRPEDPYPILQSTRADFQNDDEQEQTTGSDEIDVYIQSMSPSKHQAYLFDDALRAVFDRFLRAQQQSEQRFMSFINEQKRDDQEREERIHCEQRKHQLELIQLIINQGTTVSVNIPSTDTN